MNAAKSCMCVTHWIECISIHTHTLKHSNTEMCRDFFLFLKVSCTTAIFTMFSIKIKMHRNTQPNKQRKRQEKGTRRIKKKKLPQSIHT